MNSGQKIVDLSDFGHAACGQFVRLSGGSLLEEC